MKKRNFIILFVSLGVLFFSLAVSAMETPEGCPENHQVKTSNPKMNDTANHKQVQEDILQQEDIIGKISKLESKLVCGILEHIDSSRRNRFREIVTLRLVSKKWADIINNNCKPACCFYINFSDLPGMTNMHLKLPIDVEKHLPPLFKKVPYAFQFADATNDNVEKFYLAIRKFKECPVDHIEWNYRQWTRRELSPENITIALNLMKEHLNQPLKTLVFREVPLMGSSKGFSGLLAKFTELEHLVINGAQMTPGDIKMVIDALPISLVSLNLTENKLDSDGFEAFIKKLPQLKNLKLLGIQIGENTEQYKEAVVDFYGFTPPMGTRLPYNPFKAYKRENKSRCQILETQHNPLITNLIESFQKEILPLKDLEYIVLN